MPSGASSLRGVDAMRAKLQRLKTQFPDEVGRALYQETQVEATEVKKRTPVAQHGGDLRGSVHAVGPVREGRRIWMLIVAGGGPSAAYAIAVHEHLSVYSPPSWVSAEERGGIFWNAAGTGPKFIESVLLESYPYMGTRVARRIGLNRLVS